MIRSTANHHFEIPFSPFHCETCMQRDSCCCLCRLRRSAALLKVSQVRGPLGRAGYSPPFFHLRCRLCCLAPGEEVGLRPDEVQNLRYKNTPDKKSAPGPSLFTRGSESYPNSLPEPVRCSFLLFARELTQLWFRCEPRSPSGRFFACRQQPRSSWEE